MQCSEFGTAVRVVFAISPLYGATDSEGYLTIGLLNENLLLKCRVLPSCDKKRRVGVFTTHRVLLFRRIYAASTPPPNAATAVAQQ